MVNVLVGPLKRDQEFKDILSSYEILGDYVASPEILTFGEMDLTNQENLSTSVYDILENLPLNWKPDYILFWRLDRQIIPDGIEDLDIPLIATVFSWDLAFESIAKNISRFDWVFTDKKGEELLKKAGFKNVSSLQLRSFATNLHRRIENHPKQYDITFVGEINPELYPERSKWLYRISKLSDKYKVKITSKVYGEDYVQLLNSSKIVFNHCKNSEANQRCFEVPACNSLLFVEEDNLEIKDFFKDKEHCIFYNEDNFEELVEHYIKNNEERERITRKGYEKVQNYSFDTMFGNLVEQIQKIDFNELKNNRGIKKLSPVEKHKAFSKQAIQSHISGKYYFVEKELTKAIELEPTEPEVLNNLSVIYANAYFTFTNKDDIRLLNKAKAYLEKAISYFTEYAVARFNLGSIYFLEENFDKAEDLFNTVLMAVSSDPIKAVEKTGFYYIIPNISYHNDFKIAWERITGEFYANAEDLAFGYCDIILSKTFEFLGDIYLKRMDYEGAHEMYTNALHAYDGFGDLKFKFAYLLEELGNYSEAEILYKEGLKIKPLNMDAWLKLLESLNKQDKFDEFEKISLELLTVSKVSSRYNEYKKIINKNLAKIL